MPRRARPTKRALLLALTAGVLGLAFPGAAPGQDDPAAGNLPFRSGTDDGPVVRDPRAEQVLEEMIEAHGGEDSIAGRSTIYIRYKITNFSYPEPLEGTVTLWFKRPSYYRKEIAYPQRKQVVIYDGERAWVDRGRGPEELGPVASSIVRRGLKELDSPLLYRKGSLKYLSVARDPQGRLTQKLTWRHEGYARDLMIDMETGRLLVIGSFDTPAGAISKMQMFDDFRMVQGVLVPYKKEIFTNNQRNSETEILEVRFNEELAQEIFIPGGSTASMSASGGSLRGADGSSD